MLKSIRLVNFYSFRDATIELNQGVNVLVGINGSGKSNFLKLFELLQNAIKGRRLRRHILEIGGVNEILYQGERENDEIVIEMVYENRNLNIDGKKEIKIINYQIKIVPTQTEYYSKEKAWSNSESFFEKDGNVIIYDATKEHNLSENADLNEKELVVSFFSPTILYSKFDDFKKTLTALNCINYLDTSSASPIRKPTLSIPETEIENGGGNLARVLNTIKINNKKTYKKIVEALQRVNPHFKDFDFRPFGTNFEMLLEENGLNRSIHLSKVSDGTLRYLCLITLLLTNKNSVLCIDEPETGLHPDMLFNIAQAIKEAGKTSTVIISTHSTQLLNYFDLETVRVFEKDEDNATQVQSFVEEDFKGWYQTFQVGTMWRQGDIGGNRYGN